MRMVPDKEIAQFRVYIVRAVRCDNAMRPICFAAVSFFSFFIVSVYQYIAITNLPIILVFVQYLGQFLIDFNQIYKHSSVPKARLRAFFGLFSSSGSRAWRHRDFFCHFVHTTV